MADARYVNVEELARPGMKDDFYGETLAEVVTELVSRGVLRGKSVRGKTSVLDDEALRRVVQLGIEPLVYQQQGWSFVAVEAQMDRVLEVVRDVLAPVEVRQDVKVHRMGKGRGGPPPAGVRPLYLVKARASDWPVLVIRVHWYTPADYDLAEEVAREASTRLKTRAVAAFYDDVSDSFAQEWRGGKPVEEWSSHEGYLGFYLKFYERGIAAPSSWTSVWDGEYAFMSETPDAIERVDYVAIAEGEKKEAPAAAPAGQAAGGPETAKTAEDLLRQFARAAGAPVAKSPARKRTKSRPKKRKPK